MESRRQMKACARVGISVLFAFFVALTLASSPRLHERLHKVDSQHACAATMIASGNCEQLRRLSLLPNSRTRPIRRLFSRNVFNLLSRRSLPRSRNTPRPRLTDASRVRDGLRIHVLRSESPRALIARILVGGIFADTNRFFNDQISLQNSHCNVGSGRISSILGANTGTNHFRHCVRCAGSAPASRSPDRDGESATTTGERSAGSAGEGEHRWQSIAAN